MKYLLLALSLLAATPAAAASPYLEVNTATSNFDQFGYGGKVGVALPLNKAIDLTLDVGAENDSTFLAEGGFTGRLFGDTHLYAQGGYLNSHNRDGYRLGGGIKQGLTKHTYIKLGYQRDDFNHQSSDSVAAAFGLRF